MLLTEANSKVENEGIAGRDDCRPPGFEAIVRTRPRLDAKACRHPFVVHPDRRIAFEDQRWAARPRDQGS